jgi:hypothetical protein
MAKASTQTEEQKAAALKAKREKFSELAGKRLPKAIAALQAIAKLGSYNPSDVQKEFVLKQLSEAAGQVNAAFQGKVTATNTIAVPTE